MLFRVEIMIELISYDRGIEFELLCKESHVDDESWNLNRQEYPVIRDGFNIYIYIYYECFSLW
jgi:hypothetical protein